MKQEQVWKVVIFQAAKNNVSPLHELCSADQKYYYWMNLQVHWIDIMKKLVFFVYICLLDFFFCRSWKKSFKQLNKQIRLLRLSLLLTVYQTFNQTI